MSDDEIMDLYELLPALYRLRDVERGYPLRALLDIIGEQADLIKQNIDGLYDDLFIETCAEWVIPYIGDLVGNNPLHEMAQRRRADVAKTIYYRRRKGTLPMLEELARDVTGWGAHAVAFFELLGWTQNLNHLRYQMAPNPERRNPNTVDRVGTVNLRNLDALDRLDGPFDVISHSVDVRPISRVEGWYNIRKIGLFLWRLRNYPLTKITPRQAGPPHEHGYHFSPLGNPAPLFNNPGREADETGLAGEIHVPGPIRPVAFHFDLKEYQERYETVAPADRPPDSTYYGPHRSLNIIKDGTSVPPMDVMCKDLHNWDRPPAGKVAVDVRLGRLAFASGEEPTQGVEAAYNYGFSNDVGGGPYNRRQSLADPKQATLQIVVKKGMPIDTIQKALTQWKAQGKPPCIIQIADSRVYGGNVDVQLPQQGWLAIEAANRAWPNVRPVAISRLTAPAEGATLIVNGLLIEGGFELRGSLNLNVEHCTLVPGRTLREDGTPASPGWDSLVVGTGSDNLAVTINKSIVGPLRLPANGKHLTIRDSIVHAPSVDGNPRPAIAADDTGAQPGPSTTLERTTIWGSVHAKELTLASEVIFMAPVKAQRQQVGCVRFSYVPGGSITPRRYRCQPDLALEGLTCPSKQALIRARLRPSFTSVHYGHPAYAQLGLTCAEEIHTGAEDGSEMGVFSSLQQPQRETNLRMRLEEYLPFGLEPGLVYVT